MEKLIHFYNSQIASFTAIMEALSRKIHWLGTVRLLLFGCALISVWFCRDFNLLVLMAILFVFAIPFTILMVYHTKLFHRKEYAEAMIRLNTNELKGIHYDFSAFDGAVEATDSNHAYTHDLDIFGHQSLFQSMNRTVTCTGKECLIEWLKKPLDNKQDILSHQQAVQELAVKTHFRQHFYVTGVDFGGEYVEAKLSVRPHYVNSIVEYLQALASQTTHFSQNLFWKVTVWMVPFLWIGVITGCI